MKVEAQEIRDRLVSKSKLYIIEDIKFSMMINSWKI